MEKRIRQLTESSELEGAEFEAKSRLYGKYMHAHIKGFTEKFLGLTDVETDGIKPADLLCLIELLSDNVICTFLELDGRNELLTKLVRILIKKIETLIVLPVDQQNIKELTTMQEIIATVQSRIAYSTKTI